MVKAKEVKESPQKNYITYFLVALLFIGAVVITHLYTKVKTLEGGSAPKKVEDTANAVPTSKPAVSVTVNDDDPFIGPKSAKVVVVEFSDFQCPFCGAYSGHNEEMVNNMKSRNPSWEPSFTNVKKEYVDTGKVKFVWKDYPFLGQESIEAASAARCAKEQDKFWEFHNYLYANQKGENNGSFNKDNLKKFAANLGLNTKNFNDCLDSGKYQTKMQEALSYGQSVGVNGTPATFVNGKLVSGAVPFSQLKTMIDAELK